MTSSPFAGCHSTSCPKDLFLKPHETCQTTDLQSTAQPPAAGKRQPAPAPRQRHTAVAPTPGTKNKTNNRNLTREPTRNLRTLSQNLTRPTDRYAALNKLNASFFMVIRIRREIILNHCCGMGLSRNKKGRLPNHCTQDLVSLKYRPNNPNPNVVASFLRF